MTKTKAVKRPPIQLIDDEVEPITNLALSVEERLPQVSELLLNEIARAKTCRRDKIPADVVTMNATVEFVDEASGTSRTVQLVYPREADISAGRISIITPIGAGLIGLRSGQAILWPDRDGNERWLRIISVTHPAEAA
ncbi:nucleoside diphosphate kinase regulator [Caenibius tardaugens NBRC 16725]|uniref:Nucleoside diphosphate kinase regulator n=1 Tax=Caenibius tardaugens NBRC 16725 TaxID=1219035 RepID=U2YH78_9SPHN|nr:nucleoside diphosphate kinase regulator [Caenibius tardaugens]AZI37334.1 nucleoside diphosphate kinase regulator [Caenibius tardaugens NBRC 16725]GAD47410.1 nucleoside diphosphate kinase regulator [Caenibius tardaugens NBRC 16725]